MPPAPFTTWTAPPPPFWYCLSTILLWAPLYGGGLWLDTGCSISLPCLLLTLVQSFLGFVTNWASSILLAHIWAGVALSSSLMRLNGSMLDWPSLSHHWPSILNELQILSPFLPLPPPRITLMVGSWTLSTLGSRPNACSNPGHLLSHLKGLTDRSFEIFFFKLKKNTCLSSPSIWDLWMMDHPWDLGWQWWGVHGHLNQG